MVNQEAMPRFLFIKIIREMHNASRVQGNLISLNSQVFQKVSPLVWEISRRIAKLREEGN